MNIYSNLAFTLTGYRINAEELAAIISNFIKMRKMMKEPIDVREGVITDFRISPNIRIGESCEVSAVYKGDVKSGYFSLLIEDCDGVKQSFADSNSVVHKILDSGKSVQTGKLNFTNGVYESKWKFTSNPPLYKGYAKATVQMFEDTNVYPLTFQEKEIRLV